MISRLRKITHSPALLTTLSLVATIGLGFLTSVTLSRLLGPEGRGEVSAVLLWPAAVAHIGGLGIMEASLYFSAEGKSNSTSLFWNGVVLAICQSAIIMPLAYFLLPSLMQMQSASLVTVSRQLLWIVPFLLIINCGKSILQGKMHFTAFNLHRLFVPVLYLAAVITFYFSDTLTVNNIATSYLLLNILLAIGTALVLYSLRLISQISLDKQLSKNMLRYGLRAQAGNLSQLANLRLDQMLIVAFLPPILLGYYVVAVSVSQVLRAAPTAIRMVITPQIAAIHPDSRKDTITTLNLPFYWYLTISLGIGFALAVPVLIPTVFGAEFAPSILPCAILIVASVLLGWRELLGGVAHGLGSPGLVSQSEIVALIITVIGLTLLLPRWGIIGAAVASVLAYGASFGVLLFQLRRVHGVSGKLLFQLDVNRLRHMISSQYARLVKQFS